MRRPVEVSDVLDHRGPQLLVVPAHGREPVVRQAHHDEVEVARLRALAVHHVEAVAASFALSDLQHAIIELDVGIDLLAQALDDLLVAVLDGIEADIAVDIHHEVLQRIQPVGVVALGGKVGARHHLQKPLGDRVLDLAIEQLFAVDEGPGVLVVVRADAFIVFLRRDHLGAALAERLDGIGSRIAVLAAHAAHVIQHFAVELHLLGVYRNGLQAEMLHEVAQRVRSQHRIVIDFGDARLIQRRRRIELFRQNLAAEALGRLENGHLAERPELLTQIPGGHQAARPSPYNSQIQHFAPSSDAAARILCPCAVGHEPLRKSLFHLKGR